MLGHLANRDRRDLDVITDDWSQWLLQSVQEVASIYVPGIPVLRGKLLFGRSDHESFWAHGYAALLFFEDSKSPSPFIHSRDDVIGLSYNDTTLHALSTQVALAWVATLAQATPVPVTLQAFAAEHRGHAVCLQWRLAPEAARRLRAVHVERAATSSGPWVVRTLAPLSPLDTEFEDAVPPGASSWWYRLSLEDEDGGTAPTPPLLAAWQTADTHLDTVVEADGVFQVRFHVGAPAPLLHLGVYDVRGRLLRTLAAGALPPGEHLSTWDRREGGGAMAARGVYVVSLRGATTNGARKIVVR